MAVKILTSFSAAGQPLGTNALDWLQKAITENPASAIISAIGPTYNAGVAYVLYGCVKTSSAGTTTITDGVVFKAGVLYGFPTCTYADPVGPAVDLVNTYTIYNDGAGTVFADSSSHNVLEQVLLIGSAGASGSGTFANYSSLVFFNYQVRASAAALAMPLTVTFTRSESILFGPIVTAGTLTLSATGAIPGKKVSIHVMAPVPAVSIAVTSTGTYTIVGDVSNSLTPSHEYILELTYLGNDGTSHIYLSKLQG